MLEKLLLAATVTFAIQFLLPANAANISQSHWEVFSGKNTSTEVVNLLGKQPLTKGWKSTFSQR